MPPQSGISPILENAWRKYADFPASTMSQPSATDDPAPAATPFTAATEGIRKLDSFRAIGFQVSSSELPASPFGRSPFTRPDKSAPAQNDRPVPVSSSARQF